MQLDRIIYLAQRQIFIILYILAGLALRAPTGELVCTEGRARKEKREVDHCAFVLSFETLLFAGADVEAYC